MTAARFIHLRVHTEHSLLEGAVPVKKLCRACARQAGMPAVAVTDTNNMFAALEFSVTAARCNGVQPIVGCQIDLAYDPAAGEPGKRPVRLRRWCCWRRTRRVIMNLMKLNSAAFISTRVGQLPQVTMEESGAVCGRADLPDRRGRTGQWGGGCRPGRRPKAQVSDDPACRRSLPTGCM